MIKVAPSLPKDDDFDLTSLIDVVFILLIFFIFAASFAVHSIDFNLPSAKTGSALAGHVVEIRLHKDGSFTFDGVPTKKDELSDRLVLAVAQLKSKPGQIVVMADPESPSGELIYLVDVVRQHGGEKLHVATSPKVSP